MEGLLNPEPDFDEKDAKEDADLRQIYDTDKKVSMSCCSKWHKSRPAVEPEAGIGPTTYVLRMRYSTTELPERYL